MPIRPARYTRYVSSCACPVLFALLPKCPACLVLLLAPLGIPAPQSRIFLVFAGIALLAIPIILLSAPACRHCSKRRLCMALGGATLIAIGRFSAGGAVVVATEGALLL